MASLRLRTGPTTEPITLDELKAHLRITYIDEDDIIESYLVAARVYVENYCERSLFTQTWDYYTDRFPPGDEPFVLSRGQYASVSTFTYKDTASVQQTLTSTDYQIESSRDRFRVYPALDEVWPDTDLSIDNVNFRFVAGWSTVAAIPRPLKQAIMILAANWYKHRESIVTGTIVQDVPHSVEALLSDYVTRPYP